MAEIAENRSKSEFFQRLTLYGCAGFGIAMIANTQLACDGTWFWYASLLHGGRHLYSDMHLALQPLPVLETDGWMALAGNGWMVSKIPALFHLVMFLFSIFLLAAESAWTDLQKAALIACTFFVGISFESYRFDDYHVISHICYLLSIFLLIRLSKNGNSKHDLTMMAALGVLTGLAITTRVTDGAGLFFCVFVAIACIMNTQKSILLASFCVSTMIVAVGIVGLTGDSLGAYVSNTILHAAGPKGGAANVLVRPFQLFWNSLAYLEAHQPLMIVFFSILVAASWTFLIKAFSKSNIRRSVVKAMIGLAILLCSFYKLGPYLENGSIVVVWSAVIVLAAYGVAVFVALRLVRYLHSRDRASNSGLRQVVIFLPFALLLVGSMSSGGYHFGLYAPIAFLLLTVSVVLPELFGRDWIKSSFLVIVALMAVSGAWLKARDPASWLTYRTFPMFSERLVIHHPQYGPMVIDKELHQFIERVCSTIASGGKDVEIKAESGPSLVSIPFSYANYYCAIPPWQGFVQTFFDTSGKDVIDSLISKLEQSPPTWVFYQRQLGVLVMHEAAFNNGKRLPHHDLDDFIMQKIATGQWTIVDRQQYGHRNDWILVKTR